MTLSPFKEKISKFMLMFSNYVRIEITTALVTHNLFQWQCLFMELKKPEFFIFALDWSSGFFSGYERLAFVYLGCQSKVFAWNNTGNSAAKATVKQTNDVIFIPQTQTSHSKIAYFRACFTFPLKKICYLVIPQHM